jgi:large subunit ribosomal protein L21
MYAVIRTGGKQYRVHENDEFNVEKLTADQGEEIVFGDVLAVGNGDDLQVGTPNVDGAKVHAEIVTHGRLKKIRVFKFKRRKNYKRTKGHRQHFTRIKITKIDS